MKGIVDGERFADARAVADAVLYEGYLLYPYRASATKNRLRWQFGVVVPPAFAAADPSERASVTVGVVVDPGGRAVLTGVLRFLQLCTHRTDDETVGGGCWDEGEVREVEVGPIAVRTGEYPRRQRRPFHVAGDAERRAIDGTVDVTVRPAGDDRTLLAVAITVTNEVAWEPSAAGREEAVRHSLVGAHLLLAVDDGRFLSSIDPPAGAAVAVAGCTNEGLFPVLVGSAGRDDMMLAAPIILYDHPEVAPESPGDMFDATEIDEILALRVLTLTDDEKAQARRTDPRAAAIVDRCDDLPPELWSRLHGAIRTLRPTDASPPADDAPWWDPGVDEQFDPFTDTLRVAGVAVTAGSTVTLHPLRRADAHDMFFAGRRATVGGVFRDVDGEVLVGVTIDDDPASEALAWQRRMLFFHPDEIAIE